MSIETDDPAIDQQSIPATILTGFLGAGKTTLLNHILSAPGARRYAVIVNEFAELGIDNDLVLETQEEIVTLTNGCVCCNVRGDLLHALKLIVSRDVAYDAIVIEATGLADPAPVIQTFYMDTHLARRVRLDSVVTIIDAPHFGQQLGVSPETAAQVVAADLILLNKMDLVSVSAVDGVEKQLRAINAFASIRRTTLAKVPVSEIFDRKAFDLRRVMELLPSHRGGDTRHASGIDSVGMELKRPVDLDRFLRWVDSILALQGDDVMRVKGILSIAGDGRPFVFQAVHRIMDGDFMQQGWIGSPRSKLVFIGRNLDRARLRRNFEGCEAPHTSCCEITAKRASVSETPRGHYSRKMATAL